MAKRKPQIIGGPSYIIKRSRGWYNAATQQYISVYTAQRYTNFYKKHGGAWDQKIPFQVANGQASRLKQQCLKQQAQRKNVVAHAPIGPVRVVYNKSTDSFDYRDFDIEFGKRRKVYRPVPYGKPITGEPTVTAPPTEEELPTSKKYSEEGRTEHVAFYMERCMREYAIMDLKQHPNKFGDNDEIEYRELYPSQSRLYGAMKAAERTPEVGLFGSDVRKTTHERSNVLAEYLQIPTSRAKQTYFSDSWTDKNQPEPITRSEVEQWGSYKNLKRR